MVRFWSNYNEGTVKTGNVGNSQINCLHWQHIKSWSWKRKGGTILLIKWLITECLLIIRLVILDSLTPWYTAVVHWSTARARKEEADWVRVANTCGRNFRSPAHLMFSTINCRVHFHFVLIFCHWQYVDFFSNIVNSCAFSNDIKHFGAFFRGRDVNLV